MPFRDRMRRAFGTGHSSPSSTGVPTPTATSPPPEPATLTQETKIEHKEVEDTTSSPSSSASHDLKPVETEASLKPVETKASLKPVETNSTLRSLKKITSRKPKGEKDKRSRKQRKADEAQREYDEKWKDWDENIYKPHEMPPPRYKRTPDPTHKAALEAYNWENAFGLGSGEGRKSRASLYSPFGSRMPSRWGSLASRRSGKTSFALGGGESAAASRSASVAEALDEDEYDSQNATTMHPLTRSHTHPTGSTSTSSSDPNTHSIPDLITSSSIDSDSSLETTTPTIETSKTVTRAHTSPYALPTLKTMAQGKPFTEEELARALSRTGIIED